MPKSNAVVSQAQAVEIDLGDKGVKGVLTGTKLTLTIDLAKSFGPSSAGKSVIVATTSGNKRVCKLTDGRKIMVGVNAYIPNPEDD
jgi:hypothetical protein